MISNLESRLLFFPLDIENETALARPGKMPERAVGFLRRKIDRRSTVAATPTAAASRMATATHTARMAAATTEATSHVSATAAEAATATEAASHVSAAAAEAAAAEA